MANTQTYLLYYLKNEQPVPFYVGEAIDPPVRFRRHQRAAANPTTTKEAYVFLRDSGITAFSMEVVPNITEAQLVAELTLAGYKLFNANAGRKASTKKVKTQGDWKRMNDEALRRVESAERRTLLHGKAQQLSKSEIVATRILDALPDEHDLLQAEWLDTPGEMIPHRPQKFAKYIRWGDYKVVLGGPKLDHFKIGYVHDTKRNRTLSISHDPALPLERMAPLLAKNLQHGFWQRAV